MGKTENPFWSENVKTHFHTTPGIFKQNAQEVVEELLRSADNDPALALHRLVFYMNRAGSRLENARQLAMAKEQLENMIALRRH